MPSPFMFICYAINVNENTTDIHVRMIVANSCNSRLAPDPAVQQKSTKGFYWNQLALLNSRERVLHFFIICKLYAVRSLYQ